MATKKSTVQIRIPVALASDVGLIAAALGKTPPEYVEEVLLAAAQRDLPKVEKIVRDKVASSSKGQKQ